jgi:hypothetical protein
MRHKTTSFAGVLFTLLMIAKGFKTNAQDWKTETRVNVLFGLSQPLFTHGFNIEFNYIHHRLILDFSQGIGLEFNSEMVTPELRKQGVVVNMPWTTGFGIGYRFTSWLNLRVEPKWHRFEFYYDNQQKYSSMEITAYNSFTLGLGLYGSLQPFKKKDNFLKGLLISPSIRYWPTVSSTLKGNSFIYNNSYTGNNEEIKTVGPGIGLTALVINISIGYSFRIKKKS